MTDWQSIKAEYEQGVSQRTLAAKYGISQATISRRANKEDWRIAERITPVSVMQSDAITKSPDLETVLGMAHALLNKIAAHAEFNLEPKDIKLLADALSQIHKIELTSRTDDKPTASGLPAELLPYATLDELAALDSIVKAIEERKLQQEQEAAGIRSIHKS